VDPAPAPAVIKRGPKRKQKRKGPTASSLFRFDRSFGAQMVAGADEAGRGSLAGPLVAAAVIFDLDRIGLAERRALAWLDDSKRKSWDEREALYPAVLRAAAGVAVAVRSVRAIDTKGLHVSNLGALGDSLRAVARPGAVCLTDGFRVPSLEIEHRAVIGGDARSAAIAAASVIAKVTRDRFMRRAEDLYPGWNFAGNMGYSTPDHRSAITEHGVCPLHRMSFASVAYTQLDLGA
jgi:ribonuclease HII